MTEDPTIDQDARNRIETTGLSETLFVEAGAGTGKTHELVERVTQLVLTEDVPLRSIAAITFTDAAAAELRDRVRESFEKTLEKDPTPDIQARCEAALADTDVAAIGTLHSFALRILGEHPIQAGLPPRVDIHDEVSSQLAFEDRWAAFVNEMHDDPATEDLVLQAQVLGIPIEPRSSRSASFKDVAATFEDNWDRLDAVAAENPGPLPAIDWSPLERAVTGLAAYPSQCRDQDSPHTRITEVLLPEATAILAEPDLYRRLFLLDPERTGKWTKGKGRIPAWEDVESVRAAADDVSEAATAIRDRAVNEVLRRLVVHLARFTRDAAEQRRLEGQLDYHDLLVLARRLVRQSPEARAALHRRYQRLLLDEFQDTDPIQIEIAVLIASTVEGETDLAWADVPVEAGRLFFVGDPKQSIYRFRRADIAMFLDARDSFAPGGAVPLVQNFRTVAPVLDWVNHVFGKLMAEEEPGAQAQYQALHAHRAVPEGDHRVVLLGGEHEGLKAGELREVEAADVAAAIAAIRDHPEDWQVFDDQMKIWRDPQMADVTVLLPTRTSLRQLEDALDAEEVPYRVDTGTLVYDTQEVREVLAALRAIDDTSDEIALVTALRSPLYACSDVDLFTFHDADGYWNLRRDPPAALADDHPVVDGLAHLRSLWEDRWWLEPSALLGRLLDERQAFALAFAHRRPREVWRRLRFLIDQVHTFQEAGGAGLRSFLDWADLQRNEGSRVHEPLLPETDDDAVSLMTIHGSKGLEFLITVVAGVTTQPSSQRRGVSVMWDGDHPEVKVRKGTVTENFDRLADLEAEMDVFERDRLLYVACTRARDHLIVCTHNDGKSASYGKKLADCSAEVEDTLCRRLPAPEPRPEAEPPLPLPAPAVDDGDAWRERREALLAPQRSPTFISATGVAALASADEAVEDPEAVEDETVADDGPTFTRRRGRAGSAIGRAVHATLQLVDLATGEHLEELAAQQAHLEAVPDAVDTIEQMARSALRAPSVVEAVAGGRLWREVYVAAPIGDRAIEGYIDLLYERDDGLVVIDYKTDTIRSEAEIDAKPDQYRLQLAAYAVALEASTGLTVTAARLVFCTTGDPIERAVTDLATGTAEVRGRLAVSTAPVRARQPL